MALLKHQSGSTTRNQNDLTNQKKPKIVISNAINKLQENEHTAKDTIAAPAGGKTSRSPSIGYL